MRGGARSGPTCLSAGHGPTAEATRQGHAALVERSLERCLAQGWERDQPPSVVRLDDGSLDALIDRHARTLEVADSEVERLVAAVAGSNFVIAMASPDGVVLDARSDPAFRPTAEARNIRIGVDWSEGFQGTNALGLAARHEAPALVHGPEHFFSEYATLTCCAAPIAGPDGRIVGILDASSDSCPRPPHTLALVTLTARSIENALFRDAFEDRPILAFHPRAEYRYTSNVGLLALDGDGRVAGLNRPARRFLEGLPARPGVPVDELFETPLSSLLQLFHTHTQVRLRDRAGARYVCGIENLPCACRLRLPGWSTPQPAAATVAERAATAPPRPISPDFVADDPATAAAVDLVARAAGRTLPVLIRGETGTGKELLARYAHAASGRSGPFVPVNCGALPEALIESELFGHRPGAFTGAARNGAVGLVEAADGGTLFFDEIGDMPLAIQGALLRLLDDWTVRPVGGRTSRRVDVQLVAATNVDLDAAVAAGRFRADLYYRLQAVEVTLPPLRRRSDLDALIAHLLARIDGDLAVTPAATDLLHEQAWPGNVRELANLLNRMALVVDQSLITRDTLLVLGLRSSPQASEMQQRPLDDIAAGTVVQVLDELNGNITATARRLGVSRNTVYRHLRRVRAQAVVEPTADRPCKT